MRYFERKIEGAVDRWRADGCKRPLLVQGARRVGKTSHCGHVGDKFGVGAGAYLDPTLRATLSAEFRGALAENFVMQALVANGLKTYYWMPDGNVGRGEIDFVRQTPLGTVAPIEVKSSRNVAARTFASFLRKGSSPVAVRLSGRDFGFAEVEGASDAPVTLKSLPLYAAFCIDDELLEG